MNWAEFGLGDWSCGFLVLSSPFLPDAASGSIAKV